LAVDGQLALSSGALVVFVLANVSDIVTLNLQGVHSAAPIWAEFMKRALEYREYRETKPFRAPTGIVSLDIDPLSGMPATPACPTRHAEVYIAGTEPMGVCPLHGGRGVWPRWPDGRPAAASPRRRRAAQPLCHTGSQGDGTVPPDSPARARQAAPRRLLPRTSRPLAGQEEEKKGSSSA
jgi:penicillin-binding protein 1B